MDRVDRVEIKAHMHRVITEAVSIGSAAQLVRHSCDIPASTGHDLFYKLQEMQQSVEKLENYVENCMARAARAREDERA